VRAAVLAIVVTTLLAVGSDAVAGAAQNKRKSSGPPTGSFFYIAPGESRANEPFAIRECKRLDASLARLLPSELSCEKKWDRMRTGALALRCHDGERDLYYYHFKKKYECVRDRRSALMAE
jgi:hypothetical protein